MGMMKMGIMLLMMCTVLPVPISRPMVQMTETMAMIIGEMTSVSLRKNSSINTKMTAMAMGAETAICLNISTPKVSSATGSPVMWYFSGPLNPAMVSLSLT